MRKALIASLALLSLPGLGRADDLQTACRKGDLAAIKALLDQGADPNAKDRHGQPLLEDALITGRVAVIKLLLEKGADVDSKQPNGDAVIFCAINPANGTGGGPEAVKLLLDKGAHVDVKNGRGNTPLAEAIYGFQGLQPDVIKLLLAKGAECAPLQAAAFRGPAAAVKDLLDKGADVHAKDGYQLTALHWAALGGQAEVAQLLLDKGADTKAGDADGRPPLQYAAAGQPAGYGLQLGGADRLTFLGCTVSGNRGPACVGPSAGTIIAFEGGTIERNGNDKLPAGKPFGSQAPKLVVTAPEKLKVGEEARFTVAGEGLEHVLWDLNDGVPEVEAAVTHRYERAGRYRVNVVAWDKSGRGARVERMVEVGE